MYRNVVRESKAATDRPFYSPMSRLRRGHEAGRFLGLLGGSGTNPVPRPQYGPHMPGGIGIRKRTESAARRFT
jgi:hypothetical protein